MISKSKSYYIIFITSLLLSSPLFVQGLFHAHDIYFHMNRIIATIDAIDDGQIVPLISPDLTNGFGYSWNIFYPPLSVYIPVFVNLFSVSYIDSMKIYIFITIFVSGITMYRFVKDFTKSNTIALISSIFYITAPYRILDIYTRGAMGEILTFVFIPIFFHGLFHLIEGDKYRSYYITIGMSGLLLSHNISALICGLTAFLYLIFYIAKFKKIQIIKFFILNIFLTIGITSFFIIPLIEHKLFGNYEVFLPNRMGSINSISENAVYLHQILFSNFQWGWSTGLDNPKQDMPYSLGLHLIIPIMLSPIFIKSIPNKKNYLIFLFLGLISVYATTVNFPWKNMPDFLSFIQFPWRFLMCAIFFLSVVAAINIYFIIEYINIKHILLILIGVFIYVGPLLSLNYLNPNLTDEDFLKPDIVNFKESTSWARASNEYLPVNANRNLKYISERNHKIISLSGDSIIENQIKTGSTIKFKVSTVSGAILEVPFIFYLGWEANLIKKGSKQKLEVVESKNGFVSLIIPQNSNGRVNVSYNGTTCGRFSLIVSLASTIFLLIYIFKIVKIAKEILRDNHYKFKKYQFFTINT